MTTDEPVPMAPQSPQPPGITPSQINTYSIMALIFGIFWLGGAGSIVALILGHKALHAMKLTGDHSDRGLAMAGYVLGWIGVGVLAACLLIFLLFMIAVGGAVSTAPSY